MDIRIKQFLSKHPLFRDDSVLNSEYVRSLNLRHFEKNSVIYRPGDKARYVYLIMDGTVKFEIATSVGQNIFVNIIGENFIFGELALLAGFDYQSSAIANEATNVIIIPKDILLALIANNSEFALKFTKQLAANFYFFQALSAEKEASDLKTRLANLLINLGLRFGEKEKDTIKITVSHNELSEMLNASRQRVSLQLKEWQEVAIIECKYGTILIKDVARFSESTSILNNIFSEENTRPYENINQKSH